MKPAYKKPLRRPIHSTCRRRTAAGLAMIPSVPVRAVPMRDRRIVKLITSKDLIEKSILVEFE